MQQTSRTARVASLEAMLLMSASTIEGTDAGEWISGGDGDNTILAAGGNDEIHAPIGNNFVDGGSGIDTFFVYEGQRSGYALNQSADGSWLLSGPGLNGLQVTSRLVNVERISFNDQVVEIGNTASNAVPAAVPTAVPTAPSPSAAGESLATDDWISGTDGNDTINAGAGNDAIHAPLGNNFIDGGSGFDTLVVYEGNRSQFAVTQLANGDIRVVGPGLNGQQQSNTLRNIEAIHFNDGVVDAATAASAAAPAPAGSGFGNDGDSFGTGTAADDVDSAPPQPASVAEPFIAEPEPIFEPVAEPVAAPGSDFVNEVVRLTNVIRAENGLAPVTLNGELQAAAGDHSDDMAFRDFFGHVNLDGQQPWDRALEAGYDYQTVGENIAAGQLTPAEVVQAWYESASHRANILNGDFTEIGIGYTYLANDTGSLNYNHYWTQLFGTER